MVRPIHIEDIHGGGRKSLLDFFGFFLQAVLFYVIALSVRDPCSFLWSFVGLLIVDTLWLVVLCCLGYLQFRDTESQWVFSNLGIILLLLGIAYFDSDVGLTSTIVLAVGSAVALAADYAMNWTFYFPLERASE